MNGVKSVVVVGCGGIGSHLIPPLCRFLAAEKFEGNVIFWDGDSFDLKNQVRQEFKVDGVGQNKATVMMERMRELHPTLTVVDRNEYVTLANVHTCCLEDSIVFVCVDNHPARTIISRAATEQDNIVVISAGNELVDGNVHVFLRRDGQNLSETLLQRHPEISKIKAGERHAGCEAMIEEGSTQLLITNLTASVCQMLAFHNVWASEYGSEELKPEYDFGEMYFDIRAGKIDVVPAMVPQT